MNIPDIWKNIVLNPGAYTKVNDMDSKRMYKVNFSNSKAEHE